MKKYMMPATEVVAIETSLCQTNIAAQSQTGDQGAPQFAPATRGEDIVG